MNTDLKQQIENLISTHKEQIIEDISKLVAINSLRDESSISKNAPFGLGVRKAFDTFSEISNRLGFLCKNFEGYAMDVRYPDDLENAENKYVAMLSHLDVVDIFQRELWESNPFELRNDGEFLYARGVNDDKGPSVLALYAMYFAKLLNFPLKYPIRLILGGAEETTWECMEHYFGKNPQPIYAFSPDGDFPIVNGEKGILEARYRFKPPTNSKEHGYSKEHEHSKNHNLAENQILSISSSTHSGFVCHELEVELSEEFYQKNKNLFKGDVIKQDFTQESSAHESIAQQSAAIKLRYQGKSSLSRNPHRGQSAMDLFMDDLLKVKELNWREHPLLEFYRDYLHYEQKGELLQLYHKDNEMGESSICPVDIFYHGKSEEKSGFITIDVRYNKAMSYEALIEALSKFGEFEITKSKKILYVNEDNPLIQALKKSYLEYTGEEAQLITKGGASYARVLDNGVAFGPTFEGDNPSPHAPNEKIRLESMWKALGIYTLALYYLCCE